MLLFKQSTQLKLWKSCSGNITRTYSFKWAADPNLWKFFFSIALELNCWLACQIANQK
ncbi:hypothetical protein RHGRI_022025 [Rhododendron griersonianum]|uniref:Uncharacterized protein n=1 Tax=Rhododendron griersonianum TaxID=479676 RepID=A0AAV6JQJ1_9ERIC|nr:hypothetical protein RHGRI_022025 [Rhododendron griersonianum]